MTSQENEVDKLELLDPIDEQLRQTQELLAFDTELVVGNKSAILQRMVHQKGDAIEVSIEDLRIMPGLNPRIKNPEYYAHIRSIADSMLSEGVYKDKPMAGIVMANKNKPYVLITDGGCRYEAILLANSEGAEISTYPVVPKDKSNNTEDLTIALVRSNQGKKFTPLELSIVVKRLIRAGLEINIIAKRLGFTTEYINQLAAIAGAPSMIRKMIESGEVPAAVALDALRDHGVEATGVLVKAVEAAKASGKARMTKKFMPEAIKKKALIKAAPNMLNIIELVKSDHAFSALSEENQKLIHDLIETMKVPNPEPLVTDPGAIQVSAQGEQTQTDNDSSTEENGVETTTT